MAEHQGNDVPQFDCPHCSHSGTVKTSGLCVEGCGCTHLHVARPERSTAPRWDGPPELDPSKTLVERLRIAADRAWTVRVADSVALMLEAADALECATDTLESEGLAW